VAGRRSDAPGEHLELASEARITDQMPPVCAIACAEPAGGSAERPRDRVPRGEAEPAQQRRGQDAGVDHRRRAAAVVGLLGDRGYVDTRVGAHVGEHPLGEQGIDAAEVEAGREMPTPAEHRRELGREHASGARRSRHQQITVDPKPLADPLPEAGLERSVVMHPSGKLDRGGVLVAAGELAPEPNRGVGAPAGEVRAARIGARAGLK